MYSVKEILEKNKEYKNADNIALKKYQELKDMSSNIDLEDVKKLSYQEVKEFFKLIIYMNNDETTSNVKEIMEAKKAELYPEILGIHYFKEIKEIDFISEEEKIKLDRLLSKRNIKRNEINSLDEKVVNFLLEKKILEKNYVVSCSHYHNFDCQERVFTSEKVEKLKSYWKKLSNGEETTDEEDEELNCGCFELYCDYDRIEITNLEEFEEHLYEIRYKLIKNPDRTLDNL